MFVYLHLHGQSSNLTTVYVVLFPSVVVYLINVSFSSPSQASGYGELNSVGSLFAKVLYFYPLPFSPPAYLRSCTCGHDNCSWRASFLVVNSVHL